MTKNEFVSILRGRITGSIPKAEVESQIDYYSRISTDASEQV